jgi:hypothetical protein
MNHVLSIHSVLATYIWTSNSWTPISARSLGFLVGPLRTLKDPEYFSDDGPTTSTSTSTSSATLEQDNPADGFHGIRHAYFAPLFLRKLLHSKANTELLQAASIELNPLQKHQEKILSELDECVLSVSAGVPHRALAMMKDVLAVPTFRTVAYTQFWIPGAVHGGSSSGALHSCPEVLNNPFLGGAIMDSRLLPPRGHRLPFYPGGRALQFLQARCAVRSWITAAIPLAGGDDVGNGYLHSLIESQIMSLYERGHGAFGEGKEYTVVHGNATTKHRRLHLSNQLCLYRWCQGWISVCKAVCEGKRA